uniref:Uncharacterized protein n=1 Tax=Rhizophora mucronata TaxID=61149 RepID=A0A2P2IY65_RHIMU
MKNGFPFCLKEPYYGKLIKKLPKDVPPHNTGDESPFPSNWWEPH